ncbi:MAG TPA: hypothetical protein V6D15_22925 [Oculatellaceae cyanobacterium]|jgi:uncharacterized protein YcnI
MIYKHQLTLGNSVKTAHSRIFTTLLLTGILSLASGLTLLEMVVAAPATVAETNASLLLKQQTGNQTTPRLRSERFRLNRLPANILNAIRQDIASKFSISQLTVVSSSRQNWTDGCLGLGTLEESCLAAIVPGWRVVVSDGSRRWTYRTDSSGSTLRLENQTTTGNSQGSVTNAVLQEVSRRTNLPTSAFRIVESERRTWSNGCLGLSTPGIGCTLAMVPGWRVVVANGEQRWVYRTNESGSVIKLDTAASTIGELPNSIVDAVLREASQYLNLPISQLQIVETQAKQWPNQCIGITQAPRLLCGPVSQETIPGWQVVVVGGEQRLVYRTNESGSTVILDEATSNVGEIGTIKPSRISASELPPPLPINVVFRAIASGGITGRTYQTTLLNNGRVIRELMNPNGTSSQQQTTNISLEQLREFQSLLETQGFSQFHRLSYDPPKGAADYITVTLTSRSGTTRYADMGQDRLPQRLNQVIQAWNGIVNRV